MTPVPLDQLSFARFSEALDSVFRVHIGVSNSIEVKLVEARSGRTTGKVNSSGDHFESFSLIFNGPEDRPIAQGAYSFEHGQIGRFDLFIVPIGKIEGVFQYEAVFNRRTRAA
jgi:hypothetical protein